MLDEQSIEATSQFIQKDKVKKEGVPLVNLEFSYPFPSEELKEVKKHISLLRRRGNEIHPISDKLIEAASNVRANMEGFVVTSFLYYAREVGVLPSAQSVLPDRLPEKSVTGVNEFFGNSYRKDSWVSEELWKNRWLCTMSNALRQVQTRGNLWVKDRLVINKEGALTYTYHLDQSRKDHFPKSSGLTLQGMIDTFPSIDKIELLGEGIERGLITHATREESFKDIVSSGFIAPYRHIRPLSLSEGVVSLPYSDHVFIFDPNVLKSAGFALMRYDENPIDSEEILEVREPLPLPVFLASGVYNTIRLNPGTAQEKAHVWSLDEPSGSFGKNELSALQTEIMRIQKNS